MKIFPVVQASMETKTLQSTVQNQVSPVIYDYLDYREFLNDWITWKKQVMSGFSGAAFARKAGFKSHTLLSLVARGERNLTYKTIRSFAKGLGLSVKEKLYFEKLVLFNQSQKDEERLEFMNELSMLASKSDRQLVTQLNDYAKYVSHWYIVVIKELCVLDDFDPKPEWIVKKLKNMITKKQAKEAWELLVDLGQVEQIHSKWQPATPAVDIDPGRIDFAIRQFHKDYLDRTKKAIEDEDLSERQLSSLTVALSETEYQELKDKINEFRKELNLKFTNINQKTNSNKKSRVVAWNSQVLSLSEIKGDRDEK